TLFPYTTLFRSTDADVDATHRPHRMPFAAQSEHPAEAARGRGVSVGHSAVAERRGMHDYRTHVEAAIRATVFHSPTTYSWFGRPSQKLSLTVKRALTTQTARSYLLFLLQSQL